MDFYLFPKFFNNCNLEELMEKSSNMGISGINAIIRKGYWIEENNLENDLKKFVSSAYKYNLKVQYADTDFSMEHIDTYENALKTLKYFGIDKFRVAHILKSQYAARELLPVLKKITCNTVKICEKIGIKAVIQIHGFCYPHNATAAYEIVKDLNPEYIGIKLDFGNNIQQEGYEIANYQIELLQNYIAAVSVKNADILKDVNGNSIRRFVPANEGIINYKTVFEELKKIKYKGIAILMPFYYENDFNLHYKTALKEYEYLSALAKDVGL